MSEVPPQIVFVVDDEPAIAETLATILNASGFQATAFTDAETVIHAAESCCPSMLISDVVIPHMNGIELAIRFKATCPECKILLFSGNASTNSLLEVATTQGHAFTLMCKPVQPKDLLAAIAKL
jgi:DNA-binding NtrC family response regulator